MGAFKELDILFHEIYEDLENIKKKVNHVQDLLTEPKVKETKPTVTLEELRNLLSSMARDGMTESVKQLLLRHGVDKLSKLNPSDYEEVYLEAEDIKNGSK